MHIWAMREREWLEEFVAFPSGVPSQDTILRVLAAVDPMGLRLAYLRWVKAVLGPNVARGAKVAIDGKTLRHHRSVSATIQRGAAALEPQIPDSRSVSAGKHEHPPRERVCEVAGGPKNSGRSSKSGPAARTPRWNEHSASPNGTRAGTAIHCDEDGTVSRGCLDRRQGAR